MPDNADKINQLNTKLESLLARQEDFYREINDIKIELGRLQNADLNRRLEENLLIKADFNETEPENTLSKKEIAPPNPAPIKEVPSKQKENILNKPTEKHGIKSDFEKFIGENLINKIGIAITVIGVAIGAKYSIEHELISPLTRIILGYLIGIGLLGFGIKLKSNYQNFSAVLVSGAIAILYFITYAAYSFYNLFPQGIAFLLMVAFTCFTVVASFKYNKQVIAHIGLVGAYAVPFLLSEGSGKVFILFTYITIINIGILIIALKKYWKPLYYSSFLSTWIIFSAWYFSKYETNQHFSLAFAFLLIFFVIFYVMIIAYKLIHKDKFSAHDILLILANAFIFYGLGYALLIEHKSYNQLLGLFTLGNAVIHFFVATVIYKQKLFDRNLLYLVAGLVIVFITIAIPIQLDGNWVTLLWAGEAALLFWIGRTKQVQVYENLSYPLMYLAFFSIIQDWLKVQIDYSQEKSGIRNIPVFNINFLNTLLFAAFFAFINYINNRYITKPSGRAKAMQEIISFAIPTILLVTLYFLFRNEIAGYWDQLYADSSIQIKENADRFDNLRYNPDYLQFKNIWIVNYTMLFLALLSFINIGYLKIRNLGLINIFLNFLLVAVFLMEGITILQVLKDSYFNQSMAKYYTASSGHLVIRYISYSLLFLLLFVQYRYIRQAFLKPINIILQVVIDLVLFASIIWIASTEMITWMDYLKYSASNKLALSILWGVCSLFIIIYGIWKMKKHLRIGAIVLFAVTLIKLFFYDISHLGTISKTIVFVSLGILLLIISFLYNKYKHLIGDEYEK